MKAEYKGNVLTIKAEKQADHLPMSVIVKLAEEIAYLSELADTRGDKYRHLAVSAQNDLDSVKDCWLVKVDAFFSGLFAKLKGGKQ